MASTISADIEPCERQAFVPTAPSSSLPFRTSYHTYGTTTSAAAVGNADGGDGDRQALLTRSLEVTSPVVRAEKGRLLPAESETVVTARRVARSRSQTDRPTSPERIPDETTAEAVDASGAALGTVVVVSAEGPVEAHRISNNYMVSGM